MDSQLSSIFWYFSWPLLIFLAYKFVIFMVTMYEKKAAEKEEPGK